jgi:molybdopterin molybdotransferase
MVTEMSSSAQSAGVLSFEQALDTVLKYCREIAPPSSEQVALLQATGRILAQPILADRDFPPFPRSTRDGYAVRAADVKDTPASLRVVGQIKAGAAFDRGIASGEAAEIMTGAVVPEGADAVVMIEHTSPANTSGQAGVVVQRAVVRGENVVAAGAEARAGQEIVPQGVRLGPAQIAMAAAAGQAKLRVYRRPHVAILATGDELVDIAKNPGPSQIRNSNSYSLAAQVATRGGEAMRLPVAPDEPRKLATLIHAGLGADMLLVSGGVSMGKFDLVEAALKDLGAEFFFTGALIQPGRPVVFGQIEFPGSNNGSGKVRRAQDPGPIGNESAHPVRRIPFFGLPGNPVSAMVCFELFARPVLEALGGAMPTRLPVAKARLRNAVKTKTGLTRFLPAIISSASPAGVFDPEVETVPWQGSGDLLASARANCYLVVPPDRDSLAAGEMASVMMRQ